MLLAYQPYTKLFGRCHNQESKKWAMSGQITTNGLGKQPNGRNFVAYRMYDRIKPDVKAIH